MTVSPKEMRKFLRIVENADYDSYHGDIADTFSLGGKKGPFDYTMKGRADVRTRKMNARYGDNAMKDETQTIEEAPFGNPDSPNSKIPDPKSSIVDRLQHILQKAGISVEEMRAGIDLTDAGKQKVAARLGISADEVVMLLGSLTTRLREDEKHEESAFESAYKKTMEDDLNEDDAPSDPGNDRFSYEKDAVGNVTVRDSQTGKSVYLQGSQATDLLSRIAQQPSNVQSILSGLTSLMEDDGYEDDHEEDHLDESEGDTFLDEMEQSQGTFNFSWDDMGKHGTGTARYKYDGHDFHIKLLVIRDNAGKTIQPDPAMQVRLENIARDFIAEENE